MKLFGSLTSPYVRHIRIALMQNDIEFEFQSTDYEASSELSPTKRVPFLTDGERLLSDSSSILLYVKQKAGIGGFNDVSDFDLYCLANTAMDAEINLFLLARDGVTDENSDYLKRQRARVLSALAYVNEHLTFDQNSAMLSDGQLRLACFLSWGVFRQRFDLEPFQNLIAFMQAVESQPLFEQTAPPK